MGLMLNVKKCEFISSSSQPSDATFQDFIQLDTEHASLLGAPLAEGSSMDDTVASRCNDLKLAIERLKLLSAHDDLILLRA